MSTAEHDRAEALAIMTADGDVTEARARAVLDCAGEAAFDRAMGDETACTCGAHVWGCTAANPCAICSGGGESCERHR